MGDIRVILGFYRDNGKENGNYYAVLGPWVFRFWVLLGLYWDYTGIREKKMETTIVYWLSGCHTENSGHISEFAERGLLNFLEKLDR